jgi:hypothetical protein
MNNIIYKAVLKKDGFTNTGVSYLNNGLHFIPLDPANRHYQEVLDAIIEQGADCFEGDIPEDLQAAADAKAAANSK